MENYYEHFVNKGNHPDKALILKQEDDYSFDNFNRDQALKLVNNIVAIAKKTDKKIGIKITINDEPIIQYYMDGLEYQGAKSWLDRKEKMVNLAHHSSYYAFLDNIKSHQYDKCIEDETYALCGGAFPLIVKGKMIGVIAVTGLRPNEDHQMIIDGLKTIKE